MNETNKIALDKLKEQLGRKLGISEDTGLQVIADDLEDALSDVLDYCNRDNLEGNMAVSVKDLFLVRYNQEGNEGESSRSECGVSQSFETGIPLKIRSKLNRYRLGRVKSF